LDFLILEDKTLFHSFIDTYLQWNLRVDLILPLLLALWIAWGDVKTRRIPNYLTGAAAVAGLGFQLGCHGWPGLADGCLGLALGFGLLILPYLLGGMGAGDVKALSALGAWLGFPSIFKLFIFMALSGGVLALIVILRKGLLGPTLRRAAVGIVNLVLCRGQVPKPSGSRITSRSSGIPYGVAIALGMIALFIMGE
jgi:prepilin peptidase CpaA